MVDYNLYKKSDDVTPWLVVSENTIDSSTTSLSFIGKRKEAYGEPQNQNFLWLLENFADDTPPTNAVRGQLWFNTLDNLLYQCVDEANQIFEKVNAPFASLTPPSNNLKVGDLWYNLNDNRLYVWDGAQWQLIGPQSDVPLSVKEEVYMSRITSNAAIVELWLNGVTSNRKSIAPNTTWLFEITVVALRLDSAGERRTWKLAGQLSHFGGNVTLDGGVAMEVLAATGASTQWNVTVAADNVNNSIIIGVNGDAAKTIQWNAILTLTKVS